jgi:hypothetical protein
VSDDRCVQPRQIYASTLTRRDRRRARRRPHGIRTNAIVMAFALTVLSVVAAVAPALV